MKNIFKILGIIAFAAVIVFSATACKSRSSSGSSEGQAASQSEQSAQSAGAASSNPTTMEGMMDEYEQIVNDYIAIVPQMNAGLLAAADEAELIADRLMDWSARIALFDDEDITPEMFQRYEELTEKLNEAFDSLD